MTEPIAAPKTYAPQDQRMSDRIVATGQLIESARNDAEIAALLTAVGYDAAALDAGLALQQAAQQAFFARQDAMAAREQGALALKEARAAVRKTYANFRKIARALYTQPADRTALALTGNVPGDNQKFILIARTSYNAALNEPYQTTFATYGYPAATLNAALAELDAFSAADDTQNTTAAQAKQATADRNTAVKAMDAWVRQFTQIAKVALQPHPALYDKLFA